MQYLIDVLRGGETQYSIQLKADCNYQDNYYGDQLCKPQLSHRAALTNTQVRQIKKIG